MKTLLLFLFCSFTLNIYSQNLLLDENFDEASKSWLNENRNHVNLSTKKGNYIISSKTDYKVWSAANYNQFNVDEDFILETSIKLKGKSGTNYGFIWHRGAELEINVIISDKSVKIEKNYTYSAQILLDWKKIDAIKIGDYNSIKIVKKANLLSYYVNEVLIHQSDFNKPTNYYAKGIGFFVYDKGILSVDYIKFTSYPATVVKTIDNQDPNIKLEKLDSNINSNDTTRTYHPNGKLYTIEPKVKGKLEGIAKTYYDNGQLESEQSWSKGVLNGPYKIYYASGSINYEFTNLNGMKNGLWKEYWPDGKLKSETPYKNDKVNFEGYSGNYKAYIKDKLMYECTYFNGKINGLWKDYWNNGKLKSEIPYKDDVINFEDFTGVYKIYHSNDSLRSESPYLNGKKNGLWKEYWNNGKLKSEKTYVNDNENGTEKKYFEDGKIESINTYKDGNSQTLKMFHLNGNLSLERTSLNGTEIEKTYNENGKLTSEQSKTGIKFNYIKAYYENGILNYEVLYPNGKEQVKGYYTNGKLKYAETWVETIKIKVYYDENGLLKNSPDKIYHKNGKIQEEIPYQNGKIQGTVKKYYENGNIQEEIPYQNGIVNGSWKTYYENGIIKRSDLYEEGEMVGFHEYDENGVLKK